MEQQSARKSGNRRKSTTPQIAPRWGKRTAPNYTGWKKGNFRWGTNIAGTRRKKQQRRILMADSSMCEKRHQSLDLKKKSKQKKRWGRLLSDQKKAKKSSNILPTPLIGTLTTKVWKEKKLHMIWKR